MNQTETKERPILFSGPMVRAILDGKKTQTRRVVKPQRTSGPHQIEDLMDSPDAMAAFIRHKCPYGQPGDRLWVRETCVIRKGSYMQRKTLDELLVKGPPPSTVYYAATDRIYLGEKKTPSIHMPRWASRIALEITGVRVERLQKISEEDAAAEGCDLDWYGDNPEEGAWPCPSCKGTGVHGAFGANYGVTEVDCRKCDTAARMFRHLWDSINAKRGFGWYTNPWVWAVEFKVMQGS